MKEWQLCNMHTIQDLFDVVTAEEVNPNAIQPEGSLGYQWYEWLAEAGMDIEPEQKGFMLAGRYFSWNYPQLKMVIHDARVNTKPDERDHFLDGVHFLVEFYS